MPHKWLRFAACLFAAGWLTACGVGGPFARQKPAAPTEPNHASQDLSPVTPLLQMMSSLPQGDPARQAELFQSAKDAAELTPTTSNKLRFALALATPAHSGRDPVAPQRQLSELLPPPSTLFPFKHLFALDKLTHIDHTLT